MTKCEFCFLDKKDKIVCQNCNSVSWGSIIMTPLGSAQFIDNSLDEFMNSGLYNSSGNFCKIIILKTSKKILLKDFNPLIRRGYYYDRSIKKFIELVFSIKTNAISKWKVSTRGHPGICWQFDDSLSIDNLLEAARQIKSIWDGIILLC